ncbi:CoxG family protein [Sphingomonas immobilis]|nr:carbon monoxide dehydrogenase subunit G [Sphingomonas sp. CA1-15]
MTGRQRIEAPRAAVWAALNDPEILKRCIPGCQTLEKTGDDRMTATAAVKIGPIGAKFAGEVTLSDLDPPNGYRISGEGSGGAAGFAKGGATVRLSDDGPGATWLDYEVSAQVGGKLAQLGGALIDATAKQMAGQFFKKLAAVMAEARPAPAEPAAAAEPAPAAAPVAAAIAAPPPPPPASAGAPALAWGIAALCAALIGFVLGRQAAGWESAGAWPGLAIGLAFVVVAGAGFAFGKASR